MSPTPVIEAKGTTTAVAGVTTSAETAQRIRRVYTPQEKADYLALFEQSEMAQVDFCREMGLNDATFSLWRRSARAEPSAPGSAPQFAEVQLSAPAKPESAPIAVMVHLPNGAKLEVQVVHEAAWQGLGLLLKTLQS